MKYYFYVHVNPDDKRFPLLITSKQPATNPAFVLLDQPALMRLFKRFAPHAYQKHTEVYERIAIWLECPACGTNWERIRDVEETDKDWKWVLMAGNPAPYCSADCAESHSADLYDDMQSRIDDVHFFGRVEGW